jgi:transmembrane sensor
MKGKDDSVQEMNGRDRPRRFFTRKPSVHEVIAEEAADWFVANREGRLSTSQSAEFAAWLRASPQNIEEYLNIGSIGRDLRAASHEPDMSLEDLVKRALEPGDPVALPREPERAQTRPTSPGLTERPRWRPQPWLSAAAAAAAIGAITLAFLFWKHAGTQPDGNVVAYNIQTRHGQQLTRLLPDNSVVKLDTDTEVSVRFDRAQRVVRVIQGRAEFKVAHEPTRGFLVQAGTVGITDVGTEFDVYARPDSTVVTVLEGRVAVAVDPRLADLKGHVGVAVEPQASGPPPPYAPVEVAAGEQVRVDNGSWPPTYTPVDTQRATAWLRRQIVFENEPLERVAAEFNRYTATPIEIDSPALRTLAVSGVFAADDTESFIAFLRSLDGVRVEVTPTRIRVSRK